MHKYDRFLNKVCGPFGFFGLLMLPALAFATDKTKVDFTGIVGLGGCSGALVRFETSLPTDPGLVLTNGHCYEHGFIPVGKAIMDYASYRSFGLLSRDGKKVIGKLQASRILYATMTVTDITLYKVTQTYSEIEQAFHVKPLLIARLGPVVGEAVSLPSGLWGSMTSCTVDAIIPHLKEIEYIFDSSIRLANSNCNLGNGGSGTPIVDNITHSIVGVFNTFNARGGQCTEDNPCEIDEEGKITVKEGTRYGQETSILYGCLNSKNEIDPAIEGCTLPKAQ